MIEQHVEFVNLEQVLGNLAHVEQGLVSLRSLWERFGEEFYTQETSLFNSQPWAPLSPAYAERKRQTVGDKPILRATDALYKSLTQQGATGNIHRVNDLDAEFGSDDFKAILHFTGTSKMPARDPLAEPDVDRYLTIAGEHLDQMVKNARLK